MAILTRSEILKEIKNGNIKIEPFSKSQIGPASIDLRLGNDFRVFKETREIYHVTDKANYKKVTKLIKVKGFLLIKPGEVVHGITKERIKLSENICGWLEGRSRFARLGLMVHVTAGLIQPGIENRQVLEMSNMGPLPLALHPGTKICQLVLQTTIGRAKYKGRFKNQKMP